MIRQLFILLIMLAWSIALLATILPAFPVKDFTGVRKAATRSDDNRMGVIATLRYEKLSDMKMPYKLENLPYLGKIIFFHLHLRLYIHLLTNHKYQDELCTYRPHHIHGLG